MINLHSNTTHDLTMHYLGNVDTSSMSPEELSKIYFENYLLISQQLRNELLNYEKEHTSKTQFRSLKKVDE